MYSIDLKDNQQFLIPYFHSESNGISDSNDKYFITLDFYNQITIWDKETHLPINVIKKFQKVKKISISKNDNVILIIGDYMGVYLYNFIKNEYKFFKTDSKITIGSFLLKNYFLIAGEGENIYLCDSNRNTPISKFKKQFISESIFLYCSKDFEGFLVAEGTQKLDSNTYENIQLLCFDFDSEKIIKTINVNTNNIKESNLLDIYIRENKIIFEYDTYFEEYSIYSDFYKKHPRKPKVQKDFFLEFSDHLLDKIFKNKVEYNLYNEDVLKGKLYESKFIIDKAFGFVYEMKNSINNNVYKGLKQKYFFQDNTIDLLLTDSYIVTRTIENKVFLSEIESRTSIEISKEFGSADQIILSNDKKSLFCLKKNKREIYCIDLKLRTLKFIISCVDTYYLTEFIKYNKNDDVILTFNIDVLCVYNAGDGSFVNKFIIEDINEDNYFYSNFHQIDNNSIIYSVFNKYSLIIGDIVIYKNEFFVERHGRLEQQLINCFCFIEDKNFIVFGSDIGYLKIVDKNSGLELKEKKISENEILNITVSPKNIIFAVVLDEGLYILNTNLEIIKKMFFNFGISSIIFHQNKKLIIVQEQHISLEHKIGFNVCTLLDFKTYEKLGQLIFNSFEDYGLFLETGKYKVTETFVISKMNINKNKLVPSSENGLLNSLLKKT